MCEYVADGKGLENPAGMLFVKRPIAVYSCIEFKFACVLIDHFSYSSPSFFLNMYVFFFSYSRKNRCRTLHRSMTNFHTSMEKKKSMQMEREVKELKHQLELERSAKNNPKVCWIVPWFVSTILVFYSYVFSYSLINQLREAAVGFNVFTIIRG